ncbi:MAG: hypothetical protein ACFFDP_10115 [Promethearchaeota archaeon]
MKVLQTEVSEVAYEGFLLTAKRKKITLKEALRQAVLLWTAQNYPVEEDPFLKLIPVKFRVAVESEEIDRVLYGGVQ